MKNEKGMVLLIVLGLTGLAAGCALAVYGYVVLAVPDFLYKAGW